jgi:hypothetical protein
VTEREKISPAAAASATEEVAAAAGVVLQWRGKVEGGEAQLKPTK